VQIEMVAALWFLCFGRCQEELERKDAEMRRTEQKFAEKEKNFKTKISELEMQISELEMKITELKTVNTELETTVVQLKKKILEMETKITEFKTRITELQTKIAELTAEIQRLQVRILQDQNNWQFSSATFDILYKQIKHSLQRIIEEKDELIRRLRAEIEALKLEIAQLKERLTLKDGDLAQRTREHLATIESLRQLLTQKETEAAVSLSISQCIHVTPLTMHWSFNNAEKSMFCIVR
jgi:chromosome segregation ATPase